MAERRSLDGVSHGVSHGIGGAGNIGADDTPYGDGEIVRTGVVGDHGDGAFSTGRGGAANIGSPGLKATKRNDNDAVPDVALRPSQDENSHVGRGGAGNVLHAEAAKTHPEGLADKLKHKIFGGRTKE